MAEDNKMMVKAQVGVSSDIMPLVPRDMDAAWRMATAFATAGMLPKSYGGGDLQIQIAKAFTAMQLGAEVGMLPMQSIQSIAVINGMPSIWGDAQLALVRASGLMSEFKEEEFCEGDKKTWKVICTAKRGNEVISNSFSWDDALAAQLTGKSGPWQTHPKRMLKYKARSFTLRDLFSDVLKGMSHSVEELEGQMIDVTPKPSLADELNAEYDVDKLVGNAIPAESSAVTFDKPDMTASGVVQHVTMVKQGVGAVIDGGFPGDAVIAEQQAKRQVFRKSDFDVPATEEVK